MTRPLLAMFTPLTPQRTGIADYVEDMLPALAARADVHLFVDDGVLPANPAVGRRHVVYPASQFAALDLRNGYDLAVYQMGNSPAHWLTYPRVFERPGILVLHDLVLHHLIAAMTLGAGDAPGYGREMVFAYGHEGLSLASEATTQHRQPRFFDLPLSQRAVSSSLGVLVHSQYALEQVRQWAPDVPAARVPMGIPPYPERKVVAARAALGLPQDAFIVASLGEASPHKRIIEALHGFALFSRNRADTLYVIVGNVAPGLDLHGAAARLGIADRVRVAGYVDRAAFETHMAAADVCMNLRYPTAGETSATALRAMAMGRPVLLSDVGANREFPDSVCVKLPVFDGEEAAIAAALRRLADDRGYRETLGATARAFVEREHTTAIAADAYLQIVEQLLVSDHRPEAAGKHLPRLAATAASIGLRESDGPLLAGLTQALHDLGLRPDD